MALWKLIPSPSQNQKQKTDSIWDKDSDGDEHLGLKMEAPWEVSVLWGALRMSLHRHRRESKPQPCILTVAKCGGAASPSHTHKTGDCKRALSASCVFLCFFLQVCSSVSFQNDTHSHSEAHYLSVFDFDFIVLFLYVFWQLSENRYSRKDSWFHPNITVLQFIWP